MKKIITMLCVLALSVCAVFGTACNCGSSSELIVYTEAGFAPFEFTQEGSTDIVGVDMEIAKYIANKYNYKLKVINGQFDTIVAGINESNALGIAGISYTADRAEHIEFSDTYYTGAYQAIVYKKNGSETITTDGKFATSNFEGKTLVCQTGTTSQLTINDNKEDWKITTLKTFDEVMVAFEEAKTTANTYLMVDSQVAEKICKANTDYTSAAIEGQDVEEYKIVAKKGNTELISKVNVAIKELLVKDSTGKTQIDKWYEQFAA